MSDNKKEYYKVRVEVTQGNRRMSNFIAAADLGLTGVGCTEVMTIKYKPEEEVDADRVKKTMDAMIAASEKEQTEFKIFGYKILSIAKVKE